MFLRIVVHYASYVLVVKLYALTHVHTHKHTVHICKLPAGSVTSPPIYSACQVLHAIEMCDHREWRCISVSLCTVIHYRCSGRWFFTTYAFDDPFQFKVKLNLPHTLVSYTSPLLACCTQLLHTHETLLQPSLSYQDDWYSNWPVRDTVWTHSWIIYLSHLFLNYFAYILSELCCVPWAY